MSKEFEESFKERKTAYKFEYTDGEEAHLVEKNLVTFPKYLENQDEEAEDLEIETEQNDQFVPKDLTDDEVQGLSKGDKMNIAQNLLKIKKDYFNPNIMMLKTDLAQSQVDILTGGDYIEI